jgi:uncharacterized protein YciU (UPF0263 family)
MEFYEEALSLCCDLTINRVSPSMWQLLEVLYGVFNRDGIDYFIEMMPVLHNYITVDTDAFLSNPAYILAIFNMCKDMLEKDPGEDPECHAAKLLEVIILQCKDKRSVDQYIPMFVQTVLARLSKEIKTSELRTMCLQVAIAALYYDANIFFDALQKCQLPTGMVGDSVVHHFIEQWLQDTDCFIGLHDRKLSILGLCRILEVGPQVPGVAPNTGRFIPSILLLFEGLKRAYENQQDSDDDSDDDSSSEIDSNDGDILGSDEDEIDESSQMYLESLQEKINTTGEQLGVSAHIEDDDVSSDGDMYEETSLESFTTPIDEDGSVDEYEVFKTVFETIQTNSPDWYAELVSGLTEQDGRFMQDVFTLCAQRKASKESKTIEQQGGEFC